MGPREPKHYTFGDQFYSENTPKLKFHTFLHFYAVKYDMIILPEMDRIHKKLWTLFQFSTCPRGPTIETKFRIFWEFGPFQVKLWYHMFSSIKMEEYM